MWGSLIINIQPIHLTKYPLTSGTFIDSLKTIFTSNEEVITAVEDHCAYVTENHYSEGIHELKDRWNMCIEIKGDYTGK